MVKRLDHIGIAVKDIEKSVQKWTDLFKIETCGYEEIPERGVKVFQLNLAGGVQIELISPIGEDSPVAKSLAKRGEGIHHFCFEVDDLETTMTDMKKTGVKFVSDEPAKGAEGSLVAFIQPKSMNGVLVELKEKNKGSERQE
jgi:methylmalonyl-CoA/ethylmalonyl-CoA epimerase